MDNKDIEHISALLGSNDPSNTLESLAALTRDEKLSLAQKCFQLARHLIVESLSPAIKETFEIIGITMEVLFFYEFLTIDKRLKTEAVKWQKIVAALRKIELFANTSEYDLMTVAADTEERFYAKGADLLVQGEPVEGVFLLKNKAEVYVEGENEPILIRSGIFGEEACATGVIEASATVRATMDSKVFYIPRDKFSKHTRRIPKLQGQIFQMVVERAKQNYLEAKQAKVYTDEQRRLTQEILDNIGQGSFSINEAGEIGNFSSVAREYLGVKRLEGAPFADIAFRKKRKALREYYQALNMLFSGNQFDPEVILSMLPNGVVINKRTFKLFYFFVQDNNGYVISLFVRMEDVTEILQLAHKEEYTKRITEKTHQNIGGFLNMLEIVEKSFNQMEQFSKAYVQPEEQPYSEDIGRLMRDLHGSKGLSGQFEFEALRKVIHDLEDCLLGIDRDGIGVHSEHFEQLFMELHTEFEYALSFKENLGDDIIQILEGISFSREEYETLQTTVKNQKWDKVTNIILQKSLVPVSKIVDNWENDVKRLAEKLGKKVDFKLETEADLKIPESMALTLNVALGHLYRNCLDHGLEPSEERRIAGKSENGTILVKINQDQQNLMILIRDDGKGINNKKVIDIAKKNDRVDQALVEEYIESNKIWKILFLPGFSSVDKVTNISGRGVGMDAVQIAVRELNGQIAMASEPTVGSAFMIRIPIEVE